MKSFWALYKKDIRQIWAISLALIVFGIVLEVIHEMIKLYIVQNQLSGNLELHLDRGRYILYRLTWNMLSAMYYIFPTVLAFLLYQNHRHDSRYQVVSLPVSRGISLLSGFTALMSYVAVYSLFSAVISSIFMVNRFHSSLQRLPAHVVATLDHGTGHYVTFFKQEFVYSLYVILFYSGIVCLATGIMGARRCKSGFLYWAGFCGVFLAFNLAIMSMFDYFENLRIGWLNALGIYILLFTGLAFTTIGGLLYSRHAEV